MDERQLLELAKELGHRDYHTLGIILGIPYAELEKILIKKSNDYTAAFLEVLHQWKDTQQGNSDLRLVLGEKLIEAELVDLGDQLIGTLAAELRDKVLDLKKELTGAAYSWQAYDAKLYQSDKEIRTHFGGIQGEINEIFEKEREKINAEKLEKAASINQEADEQITKINEEREKSLERCEDDVRKQWQPIESRRSELLGHVNAIADKTRSKIGAFQSDARGIMQAIDDAAERIEIILEDDKKLLEGSQQLITSLTDTLGKTVDDDVVENITRAVKCVHFIEGVGNEKYNGRIGGYEVKWKLSARIEVPCNIINPRIVGILNEDTIVMTDTADRHAYCLDYKNKTIKRIIPSDGKTGITTCTSLGEDATVCGSYMDDTTDDSLRGCISVYDRDWVLIRDIAIPRNAPGNTTWYYYTSLDNQTGMPVNSIKTCGVHVAVDRDGMIIAAESCQSKIFVINPTDGSIVHTIRCKVNIGELRGVMSTGDIIAQSYPSKNRLISIDRQGLLKYITYCEKIRNCGIDPRTDDLYVVYWDKGRKVAVIDQLCICSESNPERTELFTFVPRVSSTRVQSLLINSLPVIRTSGEVVVCNGKECLIFKKTYQL